MVKIIPERDVYRLVMRSKLPAAERFEEWVVGEVLPSIRKHGGYLSSDKIEEALSDPDTIIRLATDLKEERKRRMKLGRDLAETKMKSLADAPKVEYFDQLSESKGLFTTTTIAKRMSMSAKRLNSILHEMGVLFRSDGGWVPYSKYQDKEGDYFKFVVTPYLDSNGNKQRSQSLKWTEAGAQWMMAAVPKWLKRTLEKAV